MTGGFYSLNINSVVSHKKIFFYKKGYKDRLQSISSLMKNEEQAADEGASAARFDSIELPFLKI